MVIFYETFFSSTLKFTSLKFRKYFFIEKNKMPEWHTSLAYQTGLSSSYLALLNFEYHWIICMSNGISVYTPVWKWGHAGSHSIFQSLRISVWVSPTSSTPTKGWASSCSIPWLVHYNIFKWKQWKEVGMSDAMNHSSQHMQRFTA